MAWQFELPDGGQEAFERFYGADGPWTALSRQSRSYLGSSFLRDQVQPTRYLLIEYWSEMVVYRSIMRTSWMRWRRSRASEIDCAYR